MKYIKDAQGVHGFDETDAAQVALMEKMFYANGALNAGCVDVTGSWPPAPIPPSLASQAKEALDIITGPRGTIIRCMAAGVAVPATWVAYVQALRAIANGTDTVSTALPTKPAYPAGT